MTTTKLMLLNDIDKLKQYIETNGVGSYMLLVNNDNRTDYFTTYDFNTSPNDLIANLELLLTEIKMRLVIKQVEELQ